MEEIPLQIVRCLLRRPHAREFRRGIPYPARLEIAPELRIGWQEAQQVSNERSCEPVCDLLLVGMEHGERLLQYTAIREHLNLARLVQRIRPQNEALDKLRSLISVVIPVGGTERR